MRPPDNLSDRRHDGAGRLVAAWLLDRYFAPLLGAVSLLAAAFGASLLARETLSTPQALVAIALLGLTSGVEVDLLPYLVVRYFGRSPPLEPQSNSWP